VTVVWAIVLLWILFPPALHPRLRSVRRLQATEESYMREFVAEARAHPVPEPGHDANLAELERHLERQWKGPVAEMPLRFDVNRDFEAFERLRMDDGFVLDCSTFKRPFPHRLVAERTATIVPLDCRMRY
jgi:hypothetical protein